MDDAGHNLISSVQNATVRRLVRLRDNRYRRRHRRVLTDGWRETFRAIEAGLELCGLYVRQSINLAMEHDTLPVNQVAEAAGPARIRFVSDAVMRKIGYSDGSRHVVGEFHQPSSSIASLSLEPNPLVLVLDGIEKPGNVGAVFRCADAAGVDAVVSVGDGTDLYNPNAIRSSLGTVFSVPNATATDEELVQFLGDRAIRPLAARVESAAELWNTDLSGGLAIIVGSESTGLGDRWSSLNSEPIAGVRIPMLGAVDSLNVSVSAALIVYEAARQRRSC